MIYPLFFTAISATVIISKTGFAKKIPTSFLCKVEANLEIHKMSIYFDLQTFKYMRNSTFNLSQVELYLYRSLADGTEIVIF